MRYFRRTHGRGVTGATTLKKPAPLPITMTRPTPPSVAGGRSIKEQTMRLRKMEWMSLALVAGLVAGFGSWLQSEMNRASFARTQRETLDLHGACNGMTLQESQTMDKGALWCGVIDPARGGALNKS